MTACLDGEYRQGTPLAYPTAPPDLEDMMDDTQTCDSCGQPVQRDRNDWWVGADNTSDCPNSEAGHTVDGEAR